MPPTEYGTVLPPMDTSVVMAALRQHGAQQFDPVGFYYLETLAQRTHAQQGRVKQLLECKLVQALRAFQARFEHAHSEAQQTLEHMAAQAASPLAELVSYLAQQAVAQASGSQGELKTTRYFRNTWSKLSVDKRVAQALGQAPQNAGPMNSHRLVLDSLALMREISPDYLNRFTSYVDSLLCLEQGVKIKPAPAKKVVRARGIRK
ncbi:MAG: hypothetical protein FD135_3645 [Comamonadaceae bacterium]|nr:MAG: hypothetical protein FD135_3645 [Comamonadaceae bacterium]